MLIFPTPSFGPPTSLLGLQRLAFKCEEYERDDKRDGCQQNLAYGALLVQIDAIRAGYG